MIFSFPYLAVTVILLVDTDDVDDTSVPSIVVKATTVHGFYRVHARLNRPGSVTKIQLISTGVMRSAQVPSCCCERGRFCSVLSPSESIVMEFIRTSIVLPKELECPLPPFESARFASRKDMYCETKKVSLRSICDWPNDTAKENRNVIPCNR
jgi:hypothetical protein